MNDSGNPQTEGDAPAGFKLCVRCGEIKPIMEFHKDRTRIDGHRRFCRHCTNLKRRADYQANPEPHRLNRRRYRANNLDAERERNRIRQQNNRAANPDLYRQKDRERYANNPEAKRERSRQWYADNREKAKARIKQWVMDNPERKRATNRRYHRKHTEQVALKSRLWAQKHPEKSREFWHRRRSRKTSVRIVEIPNIGRILFDIQNGLCLYCQCDISKSYHLDHIIPLALVDLLGQHHPGHVPSNLALACPHCNLSKCDALLEDWLKWKYPDQMDEILKRVDAHIAIMTDWWKQQGD